MVKTKQNKNKKEEFDNLLIEAMSLILLRNLLKKCIMNYAKKRIINVLKLKKINIIS